MNLACVEATNSFFHLMRKLLDKYLKTFAITKRVVPNVFETVECSWAIIYHIKRNQIIHKINQISLVNDTQKLISA